ncbi:Receptor expression-enhancing protein 5 [Nymphon striatum]|nr:Receptor expression-enhancing protein 5 [Nymphon striatum]
MAASESYLQRIDKKLHEKNMVTDYLEKAEKASGVKRLYLALGTAGFIGLWLAIGYGGQLLCNLIGFGYPAYESIKAIESKDQRDDTKWLTYWVVYAAFGIFEFFSDIFLDWFPFYWLLKCIFLVWCFLPFSSNGSTFIYAKIIKPFFLKNQAKIDEAMDKLKDGVTDLAGAAAAKAAEQAVKQD